MEARRTYDDIVFQHLVDLPSCDSVFCSTRERKSGRVRLFLISNEQKRIYIRNGVKDTWDELKNEQDYDEIRRRFNSVIIEREIPCYTSAISNYDDMLRG